jgi:Lar family restriction alleviation protein
MTDSLNDCPFRIGDKVKVISPLLKKEWENSPAFIVGINLKGGDFDRYDFTLREIGSKGVTDGWGIHDIKCIERSSGYLEEKPISNIGRLGLERRLRESNEDYLEAQQREISDNASLVEALESLKAPIKPTDSDDAMRYAATRNSVLNEAIAVARQDRFNPEMQAGQHQAQQPDGDTGLKPCPYCGCSGLLDDSTADRTVVCSECGAQPRHLPLHHDQTKREAYAVWNTRATEPVSVSLEDVWNKLGRKTSKEAIGFVLRAAGVKYV